MLKEDSIIDEGTHEVLLECNNDEDRGGLVQSEEDLTSDAFLPSIEGYSTEELMALAKLAEEIESYVDMRILVKKLALAKLVLDNEERLLLSMAYKYAIRTSRGEWRKISQRIQEEQELIFSENELLQHSTGRNIIDGSPPSARFTSGSWARDIKPDDNIALIYVANLVRSELEAIAFELITLIRDTLLIQPGLERAPDRDEAVVFYRKLIADYYRYLAEHLTDDSRHEYIEEAKINYDDAMKTAEYSLDAANSTRLSLALNVSVFYFEILNKPDRACEIAKTAHDAAVGSLNGTNDRRDSVLLLNLLRENLNNWALSEST